MNKKIILINKKNIIFVNNKFKNINFFFSMLNIKNKKILIVCSDNGKKRFLKLINNNINIKSYSFLYLKVNSEPTLSFVNKLIKKKNFFQKFNNIIAFGGGSVIDVAKIVKFIKLYNKKLNKFDSNKLKSSKKKFKKNNIKILAIPTTSGTGSEVTSFATIWDIKNKKKLSISENILVPNYSIIDPCLTKTLPKNYTLFTALDALNQLYDSFWSKKFNKGLYSYFLVGLNSSIKGFNYYLSGNIEKSRYYFSIASLCSGMCINVTKTSLCHSISYPLTLYFNIPHGLACSFSQIAVLKYVALKTPSKFKILENIPYFKNIENFIDFNQLLLKKINIKQFLSNYITKKNLSKIINQSNTKGRSDNFYLKVDNKLLDEIITSSGKINLTN